MAAEGGNQGSSDCAEDEVAPEDRVREAEDKVRTQEKEAHLAINREPVRKLGGPEGSEVEPKDVADDLHATSGLLNLTERDGRAMLPGTSSYDPRERKASALQLLSKLHVDMMSQISGVVDEILDQEAAREKEVRRESFQQGKDSEESNCLERSLQLESEVARFKDQACKADTLANFAVRERDGHAYYAAEAKARANQLKEANERLARTALYKARAAMQERVEVLERKTEEAEDVARRAEKSRADALGKVARLIDRAEQAENSARENCRLSQELQARAERLEQRSEALEAEVAGLQQEASRLSDREAQLTEQIADLSAKLTQAEAAAEASALNQDEERARAAKAESKLEADKVLRAQAEASLTPLPEAGISVGEGEEIQAAELKARSEAKARDSEIWETQSNVEYFNAAVEEIQAEFPQLDLSRFLIPFSLPPALAAPSPSHPQNR